SCSPIGSRARSEEAPPTTRRWTGSELLHRRPHRGPLPETAGPNVGPCHWPPLSWSLLLPVRPGCRLSSRGVGIHRSGGAGGGSDGRGGLARRHLGDGAGLVPSDLLGHEAVLAIAIERTGLWFDGRRWSQPP